MTEAASFLVGYTGCLAPALHHLACGPALGGYDEEHTTVSNVAICFHPQIYERDRSDLNNATSKTITIRAAGITRVAMM